MNKLAISFSGGRTSAYMLLHCLKHMPEYETAITFANTGCEHEATLDFVNKIDILIGGRVVWLEGVTCPEQGEGMKHKVVSYETASRNGEPFEAAIAKYGIPGPSYPNCTGRLKTEVMEHYLKTVVGWPFGKKLAHKTAIGIRYDELRRRNKRAHEFGFIYPLIDAQITKDMVVKFWENQPFDLELPGAHYGNCTWCWKKSARKLMTLANESPSVFDFPAEMERKYETVKAKNEEGVRRFFRGNKTTGDIFEDAKKPFEPYVDNYKFDLLSGLYDEALDFGGTCSDSCEIGANE